MRRTFWLPMYEQKVIVIVSTDPPNVAARKHRLEVPFPHMHAKTEAQGVTWDLPGNGVAVCLPPKASVDLIAHESMHVAFCVADRVGLDWEIWDTNEHLAYIVGYVAQQLWLLTRVPPKSW